MKIRICAMVFGFQRRFSWQLSSLCEQRPYNGNPVPLLDIHFDVTERDPFFPLNQQVMDAFSPHLDLTMHTWAKDDETYGRRGHIRSTNIQAALTDESVDWLLFVDGDMVYAPMFFAHLATLLPDHESNHKVLATYRDTMAKEDGYRLVEGIKSYKKPITNVYARARTVETKPASRHRISGAGFFQLVNMKVLRYRVAHENPDLKYYVDPSYNKDHNTFEQNHITRSDKNFRNRLGGITSIHCLSSVHINHYRKDNDEYPYHIPH